MSAFSILPIAKKQAEKLILESSLGGSVTLDFIEEKINASLQEVTNNVKETQKTLEEFSEASLQEIKTVKDELSEKAPLELVSLENDGLMSALDKEKIDSVEIGAQVNTIDCVSINDNILVPDDKCIAIQIPIMGITINKEELIPNSNKTIDISLPTKLSDLTDDLDLQNPLIDSISVNNIVVPPDEHKNVSLIVPTKLSELENDTGYESNSISYIKVNGVFLESDESKTVNVLLPTKLSDLVNDMDLSNSSISNIVVNDNALQPDSDGNINLFIPIKTSDLTNDSGFEVNKINGISINGINLSPNSDRIVNLKIPIKLSELTNDSDFATLPTVTDLIKSYISGVYRFCGVVESYTDLPTSNVASGDAYIIKLADPQNNINQGDNAIAIVDTDGTITWNILAGTIDLSNYVMKESGKGLSSNDFTSEYKDKLDKIEGSYSHPSYSSCSLGIYKISVDNLGHISQTTPISKTDLTSMGLQSKIETITKNEIDAMFADW